MPNENVRDSDKLAVGGVDHQPSPAKVSLLDSSQSPPSVPLAIPPPSRAVPDWLLVALSNLLYGFERDFQLIELEGVGLLGLVGRDGAVVVENFVDERRPFVLW